MPSQRVELVIDKSVRGLCSRSYPLHPKGCPNFGKRPSCPPQAPFIEDVLDLSKPIFVIWNVFAFRDHIQKMRVAHPDWSQRQLECCLYWQGSARKVLHDEISVLGLLRGGWDHVLVCPEACGVNITETMRSIGEILEWPPVTKTYQVAIAGIGL